MKDDNCIFCGIAAGKIGSRKVYEDERCIAILDLSPATKGHTLVIPKEHFADLFAMTPEEAAAVMGSARKVAGMLLEKLHPDGMNMMQNNGEIAGQTVMHYHIHLVPRYRSDPEQINWKPPQAKDSVLESVYRELTA